MNTAEKLNHQLITWLFAGCFLVFGMVIVGGITRLTGSGLSITEWKVITGTVPPLNEAQWLEEFDKYKQIPQYTQLNSNFTLQDFKFIYFWEYIHRLFGRLIGLVFIAGLIYFLIRKAVSRELLPRLLFMFLLGGFQGFLGWYMVSSGLTENVRVSHIRLAIHLTFAFITFGYVFWVALTLIHSRRLTGSPIAMWVPRVKVLLVLLTLQIIYGAFVAGTKAGWTYNTWPMMGDEWVPESIFFAFQKDGISSLINNLASIQFIHRGLAYILAAYVIWFVMGVLKSNPDPAQKRGVQLLILGIILQVVLGILTLVMQVPVWMGVTHQAVAFLLFAITIYLIRRLRYC
jgi:cytochrome c oxidase assembly protein subunit 15